MPIYTVYAKITRIGKHTHHVKNTSVYQFYEQPLDLWDLINYLCEAARNIHYNFNQQVLSIVTIEKHLGGRYLTGMKNYRDSRTHFRRNPEFKARLRYNPNQDTVKVENAVFITPEFYAFKDDFDREKGLKRKLKPLIEAGFEATLHNPESIYFNLLPVKNTIYDTPPTEVYSAPQERQHAFGSYTQIPRGMYGPSNENTLERDKHGKESQH